MQITLKKLTGLLKGKVLTGEEEQTKIEITGGYVSDLLSDVMGNAEKDQVWITIMRHMNVIAVASLTGISAVIFGKGIVPDGKVIEKARAEKICLITSNLPVFDITGLIYKQLKN